MTPHPFPSLLSGFPQAFTWQIVNHLWQSTVFAAAAALLVLTLRRHQARVRYGVWLAASLKFLVPFTLFSAAGSGLAARLHPKHVHFAFYLAVRDAGQTFAPPSAFLLPDHGFSAFPRVAHPEFIRVLPILLALLWLCGFVAVLVAWTLRWWRLSSILNRSRPLCSGREFDALRNLQQSEAVSKPIQIVLSPAPLEPGIFGILRPVLVWPAGMSEHLDDAHLEAILAHELVHVRRRDNLAAALHMFVQAVFWFHPLVWWLAARLVEERERACDEAVMEMGTRPEAYAESLLKACRFCIESPLACVSGVTGADLRARVVRIMSQPAVHQLGRRGRLLIGAAVLAAIGVPLAFGLAHPPTMRITSEFDLAQAVPPPPAAPAPESSQSKTTVPADKVPSFAVASIKPDKSGTMNVRMMFGPDGFTASNIPLKLLIREAYGVNDDQISGAPDWTDSARFDIDAKVDSADVAVMKDLTFDQRKQMVAALLVDRFGLKTHTETRDLPVYVLVIGKGGSKLHAATPGDISPNGLKGAGMIMFNASGQLTAQGVPVKDILRILSQQTGRTVLDKTGLTGDFDFTLQMPAMHGPMAMPHAAGDGPPGAEDSTDENTGPSIFTAVEDQLGLKLESQKAPLPLIVIDHIEQPSEN